MKGSDKELLQLCAVKARGIVIVCHMHLLYSTQLGSGLAKYAGQQTDTFDNSHLYYCIHVPSKTMSQ